MGKRGERRRRSSCVDLLDINKVVRLRPQAANLFCVRPHLDPINWTGLVGLVTRVRK